MADNQDNLRLVPHSFNKQPCDGAGLPVHNLGLVYINGCVDDSFNPPKHRLGEKRWICPMCEQTIKATELTKDK